MTTATANSRSAREAILTAGRPKAYDASRLLRDLMDAPLDKRRAFMRELPDRDRSELLRMTAVEMGTPFGLWQDDPLGFVYDVLGERTWSLPRKILRSIPHHQRIAVPSAFSTGKTWSVSRSVLWHSCVFPVGTALVVTIAAKFDQVSGVIWPEIRRAHARAGLPGTTDVTQMKMLDRNGNATVVARGIGAAPHNETAVQGIHAPRLMLIVDEAGGISRNIGRNLRAVLTAEGTSMVAIGNPPTDDEAGWFETLCGEENVLVIPISAMDTPNLTGERVDRCLTCPPEVPPHRLSKHLAGEPEVRETIELHGLDSNYVQAKVLARFPKGGPSRALPSQWIEDAADTSGDSNPPLEGQVRLSELDLPDETSDLVVNMGAWVRLGVDIASDGGDEMSIARMVGDLITEQHASSGATNTDPMDVAGKILFEIRKAEALRKALGTQAKVRVKVDVIGLGWGVVGILKAWGEDGTHDAEIVGVDVSEGTYREVEGATLNPANKRAEMWLGLRTLVMPSRKNSKGVRLRVSKKARAQLSSPMMKSNSHGQTLIESKKDMKKRGLTSPDRAESVLLVAYEPLLAPVKRKARLLI